MPSSSNPAASDARLTMPDVVRAWWPLGMSWMLMGLELPIFAAAVARLPHPEINLAAHGGVVFPLALIIEAPIMMLLAASTALARDTASFALVRRFMMTAGFVLTLLHALIAFTPLFDVIARSLLGAPDDILEPARLGLQVMLPWTWSIAYRRFHQGLLIRFGRTRPVAAGTMIRLIANVSVLALGSWWGKAPGIVVGTVALSTAVMAEALFVGLCARSIVEGPLKNAAPAEPALTAARFLRFYTPLALTQVLSLGAPPLSAAAMSRMPEALASLAAWPSASGLSFMLRGPSFALHEIVVSLLDRPGGRVVLRRFMMVLAAATGLALLLVGATPLGQLWFSGVSGLPARVAELACVATILGVLHPPLTALENWHQAQLVHSHRTRVVTAGMAIYLGTLAAGLAAGLVFSPLPGLLTATLAVTLATAAKVLWLAKKGSGPP